MNKLDSLVTGQKFLPELKPCPLCGGNAVVLTDNCDDYWFSAYVKCTTCEIRSPNFLQHGGGTYSEADINDQILAAEWWNELWRKYVRN